MLCCGRREILTRKDTAAAWKIADPALRNLMQYIEEQCLDLLMLVNVEFLKLVANSQRDLP
jgi:hypothetical protein